MIPSIPPQDLRLLATDFPINDKLPKKDEREMKRTLAHRKIILEC
jgi:hypothetical protein